MKYIDTFVTCTTDKDEVKHLLIRECGDKDAIAEKVVDIASTVNKHKHSKSCRKYRNNKCRFNYPKLPSRRTIITKALEIYYKDELSSRQSDIEVKDKWLTERMKTNNNILENIKEILASYDGLQEDDSKLKQMENQSLTEALNNLLMTPNIQKYISPNQDIIERYEEALATSGQAAKTIILKRHPKERYMNNYNPE